MIYAHLTLAERLSEWLTRERWETVLVRYAGQRWVALGLTIASCYVLGTLLGR